MPAELIAEREVRLGAGFGGAVLAPFAVEQSPSPTWYRGRNDGFGRPVMVWIRNGHNNLQRSSTSHAGLLRGKSRAVSTLSSASNCFSQTKRINGTRLFATSNHPKLLSPWQIPTQTSCRRAAGRLGNRLADQQPTVQAPYRTIEGRLDNEELRDLSDVLVLALRAGSAVAGAYAEVDPDGYFSFNGLYRDRYLLVAFELVDDERTILMSEFGRDLRSEGDELRAYRYPQSSGNLIELGTLRFDTGRHELDVRARQQVQQMSEAVPTDLYLILWFGHADERGDDASNEELGRRRAVRARDVAREVAAHLNTTRHIVASFGENWPAEPGDWADALAANRRVVAYAVSIMSTER